MEYAWYYDLVLLYVVYSFLGWVGETVVAAARGRGFVKRGFAAVFRRAEQTRRAGER